MTDKKEWFRYVPSNESEEKMAYAWRVSARNYLNNLEMFPDFSLHDSVFNNNLDYDGWKLKMDSENIKVKIYGNGNQIVKSPRIEFECEPSKKDLINKLIEDIHL